MDETIGDQEWLDGRRREIDRAERSGDWAAAEELSTRALAELDGAVTAGECAPTDRPRSTGPWSWSQIRLLSDRAWQRSARRDFDAARSDLIRAETLAVGLGGELGFVLADRALLERRSGDLPAAERCAVRAVAASRDSGGTDELSRALFVHGTIQALRGRFTLASEALREADARATDEGLARREAEVKRERAAIARACGQFAEAHALLSRAGELSRREGLPVQLANVQRELAALAAAQGRVDEARELFASAADGYRLTGYQADVGLIRRRSAMLLAESGEGPEQAIRELRELVDDYRADARSDASAQADAELRLGAQLAEAGELAEATEHIDAAEERYRSAGHEIGSLRASLERASLLAARDQPEQAVTLLEAVLPAVRRTGDRQLEASVLGVLAEARIAVAPDAPGAALPDALAAVEIWESIGYRLSGGRERAYLLERRSSGYRLALVLAANSGAATAGLRVLEAGRAEAVAAALRHGPLTLDSPVQEALVRLRHLERDASSDDRERELLLRRIEDLVSSELRAALDPQPVSVEALLNEVSPGSHVVVVAAELDDPACCWSVWVPGGEAPRIVQTRLGAEAVNYVRRSLRGDEESEAPYDSPDGRRELAEALLPAGLRQVLRSAPEPVPLTVVAAGTLAGLPVAALLVDGVPLVERAVLTRVPTMRLLSALRAERPGAGAFVAAQADLPGINHELRALTESFPGWRRIAPAALPEFLADGAEAYRLGVIDGHGVGVGLDQAVVLAGQEPLRAAHLLGARLPAVLCLGSCWSAHLDESGVAEPLGLPTAALLAGSRTVVGGLFPVPSITTSRVLAGFYRRLARGERPASALRAAQLAYLARWGAAAPAAWAGVVIVGRG